jgi:sulfopyruvate decarboxylase subunit beta
MKRFDAIQEIARCLTDELVVCNLGFPARELFAICDRPENFYMLGSMGLASSISLGLTISQPSRRVLCIEGDGALLMNLGSLATIANVNPPNLTLVVIDNGTCGSTGDQPTATSGRTLLDAVARGSGFSAVEIIGDLSEIELIFDPTGKECSFFLVKVDPGNAPVDQVSLTPTEIKLRFMQSIRNGV